MESIKRRQFIKAGAALGTGLVLAPWGISTANARPAAKTVRIGFVGVGSRGFGIVKRLLRLEGVEIPAVCDIDEENLKRAIDYIKEERGKAPKGYSRSETDFKRLCARNDLDLVITATSWEWHTPVCLAAMEAGKHAASEVPIAVSEQECWQLVETAERTGKICTMLENVSYIKNVMTISKMIHQGVFGKMLHAAVGYQHDIRPGRFNPKTQKLFSDTGEAHWRIKHHEKRDANLYPTHPIGPVAQWFDINRGDRFSYLVSMSTPSYGLNVYAGREFGADHPLAKREYAHGDINTTLIKTEKGLTVTLYHDVATYRPYDSMFRVQGTEGIYEATHNGIYLHGLSPAQADRFHYEYDNFETAEYVKAYEPKIWKEYGEQAKGSGHGGGDFFVLHRLITAIQTGAEPDIDVYDSVTWCVITDLTEQSIKGGSKPVNFPDFTKGKWETRSAKDSIFVQ